MNKDSDLIERLQGLYDRAGHPLVHEAIAALSPVLPEEVEKFCRELSWFRGCDDWELDEFLIEINKDREKAVNLIKRLARENDKVNHINMVLNDNRAVLRDQIEEIQKEIKECLAEAALTGEVYLARLYKFVPELSDE